MSSHLEDDNYNEDDPDDALIMCEEYVNEVCTLKFRKSILRSKDLEVDVEPKVKVIDIKCDIIQIDCDFPSSFRGRDVIINADTIDVLEKSILNVSGNDQISNFTNKASCNAHGLGNNGSRGYPGQNGGNCKINYKNIKKGALLTIESNGGMGSDGQDGGCGRNGSNGRNAQLENFTYNGNQVTTSKFCQLINKMDNGKNVGSQKITYIENSLEKQIIFDSEKCELLMLVKGSKGEKGKQGGLGGFGGEGGKPGKLKSKKLKVIGITGQNGNNGLNGFNGKDGIDGGDAFMIIQGYDGQPIYGGLDNRKKYELLTSSTQINDNSIFYEPLDQYFYISEILEDAEGAATPSTAQTASIKDYEISFCVALVSVLKNSNQLFFELKKKLKINKFLDEHITVHSFFEAIMKNSFDIPEYDNLKYYAQFLMLNRVDLEEKIMEILREYTKPNEKQTKNIEVCDIKGKILTFDIFKKLNMEFIQLNIICDIFHIKQNLPKEFRGKNVSIFANTIHVHNQVEWNLSGYDKVTTWNGPAKERTAGIFGVDGQNGGNFRIECKQIVNPSLWTIMSNGGNGSDGQDGSNGSDAVDGRDPEYKDFNYFGNEINSQWLKSIQEVEIWIENGIQKSIYVESVDAYLMLVKGSKGIKPKKGSAGGIGGDGGLPGDINIVTDSKNEQNEVRKIAEKGRNGINGVDGKTGSCKYRDGCGAVLYFRNGIKTYLGINKLFLYEILHSEVKYENSVQIGKIYYYPKMIHFIQNPNSILDDVMIIINLISVLRNAFDQFDKVVRILQLEGFSKNKISFQCFVSAINNSNLMINHFKALQETANGCHEKSDQKESKQKEPDQKETDFLYEHMRTTISEFIKQIDISTSSNIVTIKKKILMSSEFCSLKFDKDVKEFRIICDTLHINSDLPDIFQGKNLVILSNFVFIHNEHTWNLSGSSVKNYVSDAEQDNNGKGNDGQDGLAGKSGGNFRLECKFIENLSLLKITSNGGNGGDGQDGGNGRNGNDGEDADDSDFYTNDVELTKLTKKETFDELEAKSKYFNIWFKLNYNNKIVFYRGNFKSNNGLDGSFYYRHNCCIVLVHGGKGEKGSLGGVGGYGGDPGYPGDITIMCDNLENNVIRTVGNPGIVSKKGQNGWNGFHGREGGDIHKFEHIKLESPIVDGINALTKFKIVEIPYEGYWFNGFLAIIDAFNPELSEHQVYSDETKRYIKVEKDKEVKISANQRYKNDSVITRSKYSHAIANKNEPIDIGGIKSETSIYLNDTISEISNEISEFEQLAMTVTKIIKNAVPTKNPEINMESIRTEHKDYLDIDFKKIIENSALRNELQLTNQQNQNLTEILQVSEKRVIPSDSKLTTKYQRECKKLSESSSNISYEDLCNKNIKKTIESCFELLQESELSEDQCVYLIHNLESLNIEESNDKEKIKIKSSLTPQIIPELLTYKRICDIIELCKDKYSSLIYNKLYETFINIEVDSERKPEQFSILSGNFPIQLSFLKDTKRFNLPFEQLNNHFNGSAKNGWQEVFKYFEINHMNYNSSLAESIFNYLIKLHKYQNKISDLMTVFFVRSFEFDNKYKEIENIMDKKDEFSIILNDFYDKGKIIDFVKNELKTKGIQSTIYRKILAHKYGYRLAFFRRNLNGDIKVFELHNYRRDLRFKYDADETDFNKYDSDNENQVQKDVTKNISLPDLFILFDNEQFSILNYEGRYFESFKYKQAADLNFQQAALVLENLQTKDQSIIISAFQEDKFQKLFLNLLPKLKSTGHKFANIFKNTIDEKVLFEDAVSRIPKNFYTIENDKFVIYEIENKFLDEIKKSKNYFEKDESNERAKVKILFDLISKIGGISILNAITIKLKNHENIYNLEEFSTFLSSIFKTLWRKEDFVVPLTFMVLGLEQKHWIPELILIKTFKIFGTSQIWRKNKWTQILHQDKLRKVVWILLKKILTIDEINDEKILTCSEFDKIIENLEYFDDSICEIIETANLRYWSTITTDLYWNVQLDKLKNFNTTADDKLKTIFEDMNSKYGIITRKLLETLILRKMDISKLDLLEFTSNFTNGKWHFSEEILPLLDTTPVNEWINKLHIYFEVNKEERSVDNILSLIKNETSQKLKERLSGVKDQITQIKEYITKYKDKGEKALLQIAKSSIDSSKLLAIIAIVLKLKAKIELRDTQLVSILTMLHSNAGVLMQISTGEGKTFIGVAFAILKGLLKEKVDIVTSSSILAKRDATNEINRKVFDFFGISVDHNCYENPEMRKKAYKNKIVYGTLCNFQRDYLSTEFHEKQIMPDHHFENILVDEVDSLLLDKGNNILYLSQDLPDLDEIENIFILIWQWINQQFSENEDLSKVYDTKIIRNAVLDNIYGILNESIIEEMQNGADGKKIVKELKRLQIIDDECLIIAKNIDKFELFEGICRDNVLIEKIKTYCRTKIETNNQLKIAHHLKSFVLQHIDQWIESGKKALYLENEKEYIIDTPKSAQIEVDPNVNIIDLDTGTDMSDSQWDKGLHQFLQIKYGCKLSPLSLKSVFISNVSFFKLYKNLYGMTGTLGCLQEREKITKIHTIHFASIPRHVSRNFKEYIPIAKSTMTEWIECIHQEVKSIIDQSRSVLIICKTIQDTQIIQKEIKSSFATEKLLLYQRDNDKFDIQELEPGYVIISTNLAGRGTDIKLSEELKKKGGLHVILTNLPDNARIEEQAFGRAARSGEKGTGRLIIWTTKDDPISKLKEKRNQNEFRRLDEIGKYYKNFIKIEENFFKKFLFEYRALKEKENTNNTVYLLNFVIQWSFWLDQNSKLLDDWKNSDNTVILQESFEKFLEEKKTLHPVMKIELQKEGLNQKQELFDKEDDLLACQYLEIYKMLKKNQIANDFKSRELKDDEVSQIRKCLRMIRSCITSRQIKIEMIKFMKQTRSENLQPVDGYEKQQTEIIEIYEEFARSLNVFMGEDINPQRLGSPVINNSLLQNLLYNELLKKQCIKPPHINAKYSEEDLKFVCWHNNIEEDKLKEFLAKTKNPAIKQLKSFEDKLIKEFDLPNRLEFWNILKNKCILKDEIVYAIVDMDAIKNVDPSAGEIIMKKHRNLYAEYASNSNGKSIFFSSVDKILDEGTNKSVVKLNSLKSEFKDKQFNFLKEHNLIEINRKATFDIEKLNSLENGEFFGKFESITEKDMKAICDNHQKIIKKLIELNILSPSETTTDTYNLVNKNLMNMSNPYILEDDFVYHAKIDKWLKHKFAYTIALETLIEDIQKGKDKNPIIQLEINPHTNLLNDLFDHFIINQAKVNKTKIMECQKLFKYTGLNKILGPAEIKVDDEFHMELREKGLIDSNSNILEFEMDKVVFQEKYKDIQNTTLLMLQNQRKLLQEVKNIELNLNSWVEPLKRNDLESKEIILKPIHEILPENSCLHFMKLKGLGSVITIQEKLYR